MQSKIITTRSSADYELLDSGEGEKLERFGKFVLSRPDPQALWKKRLPPAEWQKADGVFSRDGDKGGWKLAKNLPEKWQVELAGIKFWVKPTPFKHTGIFPEQSANWDWLRDVIVSYSKESGTTHSLREPRRTPQVRLTPRSVVPDSSDSQIEILNLFGYTGGATLACAEAGAKVVHIDGSKAAIAWARENAEISGLADKPVRWMLDDARSFVKREIKRGRKYHGIIMDPPAFGHGPKGEMWKIEEELAGLVDDCVSILAEKPLFFLINGYASGYSAIAYENLLKSLVAKFGGEIEAGELAIEESRIVNQESRSLPCGIFAKWRTC